jgi:hypothetical protein
MNAVTYIMAMRCVYFSHYNLLKVLVFVETPAMMPATVCVALRILKNFPQNKMPIQIQRISP